MNHPKIAAALAFAASMSVAAFAQDRIDPLLGGGEPATEEAVGPGKTGSLPDDWTTHISKIEEGTSRFVDLGRVLDAASAELATDFDQYLDDPKNDLLASRLEKKLAIFADQVDRELDEVVAHQDLIVSNFKELHLKLERYDDTIEDKLTLYQVRLQEYGKAIESSEQELIGLSISIKESTDKEKTKEMQREFSRNYRRHRLRHRYVRGLERNLQNYQMLVTNVELLTNLFVQLQDKFTMLIEHLELEKDYLRDAIELQAESVKIKKIMGDGIVHGERSIKSVTERLALLYVKIDAFTTMHDKLNMGLGGFFDTQETLRDLSARIEQIGEAPLAGGEMPTSIQDAVDHFYSKRGDYRPTQDPRKQTPKDPK